MLATGRLHRVLSVEFSGEDGIDGGALRNDFFESLVSEINERLFEGNSTRRLPKKDWEVEKMFVLAGVMIAHSLIQGGPGLPVLCPPIYHFLVSFDQDAAIQHPPMALDIPQNMATAELLELINKVR